MTISEHALYAVCDRPSLFTFLRDQLGWPVDPEDTFTYTGPQLHGEFAARAEVSQIVPFTAGDPFTILLVEFQTPFRRGDLREILRRVREEIRRRAIYGGRSLDEILFVCTEENYRGIRFARFEERPGRQPKLSVFGWDCRQPGGVRTLVEYNLPSLKMPPRNVLGEQDWTQARWADAWDVEKVTREFFREYRAAFDAVEQRIAAKNLANKQDWRLFTQRLFNRLMFIQFLSRRDWLRFEGSTDYLGTLFTKSSAAGENFYHDRLYWVFFYGLGSGEVGKEAHDLAELEVLRGEVPYLNGGLFEMADEADVRGAVEIENAAFERIILDLFARWNFTVSESTPLDVEVAVDPEMLGKVFEELVTGRHESGSYYTPRGIVSFMCREALKQYLVAAGIPADGASPFVDERSTVGLRGKDFETALAALKRVRVVDPACGSGAYLLGMLHELVELRKLLFNPDHKEDPRDDYERKLEIIQRNLYGVDLDEFAINIARLRLWLSLAVEYEGSTPQPLPNLDFKIEQGDSLSAPDPANMGDIDMFRFADIVECERKKAHYADPYYPGDKRSLRREIETLCDSIVAWLHKGKKVNGFDWRVQFGEVFTPQASPTDPGDGSNSGGTPAERLQPGGFDIVLANPPYVRQELIRDLKPTLKAVYPDVYNGTADLYTYFYARALQLLRPGGMLVFISPNKWFRADYGANLRKHIAQNCRVHNITDFGDLPVFQSATAYPMIFAAQKGRGESTPVFTLVRSLESPYPDVLAIVERDGHKLAMDAFNGKDWNLTDAASSERRRQLHRVGQTLREYVSSQVFFGIKTGFNSAFYIDGVKRSELIAEDPKSAEIIRPLAVGRDIKRWIVNFRDQWQIFTLIGVDMTRYPAVMQHLSQWQTELEDRYDKGKYWWELRACAYYAAFDRSKIIYPQIMVKPEFAYDETGAITNQKCFIITNVDKYLLGVLNSSTVWQLIIEGSPGLRGGYTEPRKELILSLPIPDASEGERQAITALVQKCLDAKGIGCEAWEAEINARVAALYGL